MPYRQYPSTSSIFLFCFVCFVLFSLLSTPSHSLSQSANIRIYKCQYHISSYFGCRFCLFFKYLFVCLFLLLSLLFFCCFVYLVNTLFLFSVLSCVFLFSFSWILFCLFICLLAFFAANFLVFCILSFKLLWTHHHEFFRVARLNVFHALFCSF